TSRIASWPLSTTSARIPFCSNAAAVARMPSLDASSANSRLGAGMSTWRVGGWCVVIATRQVWRKPLRPPGELHLQAGIYQLGGRRLLTAAHGGGRLGLSAPARSISLGYPLLRRSRQCGEG